MATSTINSQDKENIVRKAIPSTDIQALAEKSRGGYDNKYRKLRGIGEYSKPKNVEQRRWQQSEISNNVRNVDKGQGTTDKGEYP